MHTLHPRHSHCVSTFFHCQLYSSITYHEKVYSSYAYNNVTEKWKISFMYSFFLCHHQVTVMGVRPVFEQVIKKLTRGAYPLLLDLSGEQTHCWGFYVRWLLSMEKMRDIWIGWLMFLTWLVGCNNCFGCRKRVVLA